MRYFLIFLFTVTTAHSQWAYNGNFSTSFNLGHNFSVSTTGMENRRYNIWYNRNGGAWIQGRSGGFFGNTSLTVSGSASSETISFRNLPVGHEEPVSISGSVQFQLVDSASSTYGTGQVLADSGVLTFDMEGVGTKVTTATRRDVHDGDSSIVLDFLGGTQITGDIVESEEDTIDIVDKPVVTLLDLDIEEFESVEGASAPDIAFFHQPEGTEIGEALAGSIPYDDIFDVSNPRVSLDIPDLKVGDTLHFAADSSGNLETGTIQADAAGNLLWVREGTEVVSTTVTNTPNTASPDPTVSDPVPNPNGTPSPGGTSNTGNNTTTQIITKTTNENNSVTINQTSVDNSITNSSNTNIEVTGSGDDVSTISTGQETASATAALQAGLSQGNSEGSDRYDSDSERLSNSLAEAGERLSNVTSQLELRFTEYKPIPEGTSFNAQGVHTVSLPLGPNNVSFDLDLNHPSVKLIRAVELVILSLFAIKLFFKIVKV